MTIGWQIEFKSVLIDDITISREKKGINCYQTSALHKWSNEMIWKGKCFYGLLKMQKNKRNEKNSDTCWTELIPF